MADALDTEIEAEQQVTAPAEKTLKPMSTAEATDSIAALFGGDPETDPKTKETEDDEDASKDPLGTEDEDAAKDTEKEEDGSSDDKATAGKYVSGQAKYKMADGTEITVADLARNNLFQRDYSGKTEEVARERAVVTKEKAEVAQLSQTLNEERQYLIWFAENFAPQPPQPPQLGAVDDPVGHLKYAEDLRNYQMFAESYRQFTGAQTQETERLKGETQKEATERARREVGLLYQSIKIDPKDNVKSSAFFTALEKGALEEYKFTSNEVAELAQKDHRWVLVLRDAIRAKRNKTAAPQVQEKLKTVPVMKRAPTARQAPNQQQDRARAASGEKLRQTGSMRDGIAAIEALIS